MSANCHGSKLNKKMIVVLRQVRKVVPEQIQEKIFGVLQRGGEHTNKAALDTSERMQPVWMIESTRLWIRQLRTIDFLIIKFSDFILILHSDTSCSSLLRHCLKPSGSHQNLR
jgi:hypothetical protein